MNEPIEVSSHVARDLLQSAALFKTDKLVVWEYVSNGLQYSNPAVPPIVRVRLTDASKEIAVADNGRGMDRAGLRNFFIMHGENLDLKRGQRGRGRFGTGKCAAFGIANRLRVTSIRDGRRNTVELTRDGIKAAGASTIPVRSIEIDTPTADPNGTEIVISEVMLRKFDLKGVISFLERHLAHWPSRPTVIVNGHRCEFIEPAISDTRRILPDGPARDTLGDIELTLKVAKGPLDADLQGVSICANGVWLETTLAGCEGQPMSNFLFGDIDVPALDDDLGPIPAFDMSRSMQLNRSNELVRSLLAFIGREVDRLRRELVQREKARRDQEEARKLAREADKIAELINEDFHEYSHRLARMRSLAGTGRDASRDLRSTGADDEILSPGRTVPASTDEMVGDICRGDGTARDGEVPRLVGPVLRADSKGAHRGDPSGGTGRRKRPVGGFSVSFRDMGEMSPRATYARHERTIFINLEHPQITAALGSSGTEDPPFRRLTYEVAFSEYAVALASEMAAQQEYIEPSEPIFDIRETLDRMARRAASLYKG